MSRGVLISLARSPRFKEEELQLFGFELAGDVGIVLPGVHEVEDMAQGDALALRDVAILEEVHEAAIREAQPAPVIRGNFCLLQLQHFVVAFTNLHEPFSVLGAAPVTNQTGVYRT